MYQFQGQTIMTTDGIHSWVLCLSMGQYGLQKWEKSDKKHLLFKVIID